MANNMTVAGANNVPLINNNQNPFGNPQLTTVDLDPATQKIIDASVDRATGPASEFAARQNAGVAEAGGSAFQSPEQAQAQGAGMGGAGGSAMTAAIRNQYRQAAGKNINQLLQSNQINATMAKSNALEQASQMVMAQQQIRTQNYENLTNAYNEMQQARSHVLSNVLGTGGSAAGAAMGSHRGRSGGAMQSAPTYDGAQTAGGDDSLYGNMG